MKNTKGKVYDDGKPLSDASWTFIVFLVCACLAVVGWNLCFYGGLLSNTSVEWLDALLIFLLCVLPAVAGGFAFFFWLIILGESDIFTTSGSVMRSSNTSSTGTYSPPASSGQKSNDQLFKAAVLYSAVTAIHQREKILDKLEDNRSDGGTDGGTDMSGY